MEKTHLNTKPMPSRLLRFRRNLSNEISDFEKCGWLFQGTVSHGAVVSRLYAHSRKHRVMRIDIDFANSAASIVVDGRVVKILTV